MIRPPSNLRPYDEFYSGDPAFHQPPETPPKTATAEQLAAHAKQVAEHENRVRVARETGDWSGLLVEGKAPTKFVMRPMKGSQYRELLDAIAAGDVGRAKLPQLAFRACLQDISNFGDFEVKHVEHSKLGRIAAEGVTDALDAIDVGIVTELGGEALRRAREPSPKSSRD